MTKETKLHVERLSLVGFITHTDNVFVAYASYNGYRLGLMGGNYIILNKGELVYSSTNANPALEKYIELLKQS